MTRTLLLRLEGPMQSWGTQSRFRDRDTGREPSKSGVVGLLCAALGRPRTASVSDLAALRMGVRVERAGRVAVEYQTAGGTQRTGDTYGVARAQNAGTETAISRRSYLADAAFLVGLEAATPEQEEVLAALDRALGAPVWPLYLGRKGYVPSLPIRLPDAPPPEGPGLRAGGLWEVLVGYPGEGDVAPQEEGDEQMLRLVMECAASEPDAEAREDTPLSFAPLDRRYATRYVLTRFVSRATIGSVDGR